ncbi:two component system sensor histidine kinase, hybrid [Desulfosarcina variabilis str. Montpellier]|uniref:PocR ligand-binding domain-containing protein n=1 Tax=Desulfosarcina variabilis TaxID=2300 RepID=UPI003AFB77B1
MTSFDSAKIDLQSLIDVGKIQSIMDDFYALTGMVTAILDLKGQVLESTGWQDICTKFHRANPETARNCTDSDLFLASHLKPGECVDYKCKNGLWDVVTPLYIGGRHMGNIYSGQFFYDDEQIDESFFAKRADLHGFDKDAYLQALARVPRYSRKTIRHLMDFLIKFTAYVSEVSLSNSQYAQEIRERKRVEQERERLMTAISQVGESIIVTDADGIIQYVNPTVETVSGYTSREVVGKTPRMFQSGKQDNDFYRQLWKTISSGHTWTGRIVNKRKDGTLYTEATTISPVRDALGDIVNYVAVKRDITDHLRLEHQFHQAQKMESVGRLAGGVAHDFNNGLSVIMGYTELALDRMAESDPLYANLQEILKAANHSKDITRQLLAFARKQTVAPKILDLNATVESMLKMLRRLIGEDIDMAWLPDSGLWPIRIDPAQVDQILANLCVNARDAIAGVGKLTIETQTIHLGPDFCSHHPDAVSGDYVLLSVSDDGSGMDSDTLDHIFEPFFTTKALGKGTGLGLSTVYGIVKQNNGFIDAVSRPGQGTTFKLYFPRYQGPTVDEAAAAKRVKMVEGQGETVLLVEDDASILQLTTAMLERLGYTVVPVNSPIEAMRRVNQERLNIDLLLTDVVMPEMNGPALAEKMCSLYPDLKCLFMSGYTFDVMAYRNISKKDLNFIHKPFTIKDLSIMLRRIIAAD